MPDEGNRLKEKISIFVEQSFDYSHFLPESDKCFPLHGHTSLVTLEICGDVLSSGMILDFGEAKRLLSTILRSFDHKLVTNRRYAMLENGNPNEGETVLIKYREFEFRLPFSQVFLLDGEGTSECIARTIAEQMMQTMPPNVSSIKAAITEGFRKGTVVEIER